MNAPLEIKLKKPNHKTLLLAQEVQNGDLSSLHPLTTRVLYGIGCEKDEKLGMKMLKVGIELGCPLCEEEARNKFPKLTEQLELEKKVKKHLEEEHLSPASKPTEKKPIPSISENSSMSPKRSASFYFNTICLGLTVIVIILGGVYGHIESKKELSEYQRWLTEAEMKYAEAIEKAKADSRPSFEKITATKEKIEWEYRPEFSFVLSNGSSVSIAQIKFRAQMTQYDPVYQVIANESGTQNLNPPLQPGQKRTMKIVSSDSSAWGSSIITNSLSATSGFRFSVSIIGASGTDGTDFKKKEGFDPSEAERYKKEIEHYKEEIAKRI